MRRRRSEEGTWKHLQVMSSCLVRASNFMELIIKFCSALPVLQNVPRRRARQRCGGQAAGSAVSSLFAARWIENLGGVRHLSQSTIYTFFFNRIHVVE